jgi:GDP-4-dehydro-6-deoxy-D-mannose reductase
VRIFNTTGPGKVNDVCADLTKRVVEIEKCANRPGRLRVGNLATKRAIMDVRDCIRAFDLALDNGVIGETYNLCGRSVYEISQIVGILKGLSVADFYLWQDPDLMRPTDEPVIWGSAEKFRKATGWEPTIPLEQTLADMLDYWRCL